MSPAETPVHAYTRGILTPEAILDSHLCGRILRGKRLEDFRTLTDNPNRKIVFLMGSDGLSLLPGKNGYEQLLTIGYSPAYIEYKVAEGTQFKLVVFPESESARLATWDTILDLVMTTYPDIVPAIERYRKELQEKTFRDIEAQAGYSFLYVEKR